ncbi:MAG: iron-containing alcohol dehydrogenase, partial [Chloroflexi bacterium]|nr:iron-containing alcohol dehydrogenase [Chloroflexota bacterium]
MLQTTSVFSSPTKMYHGFGSVNLAGDIASSLGITKAMVVTDRGIVKAGLLEGILGSLAGKNVQHAVFDDVEEDPDGETVQRGLSKLREADANGVIAVGGGSPICAAKGIALVATNGGKIIQYEGPNKYKLPPLPVVAIPTTAGSGSDVSRWFVLHSKEEQRSFVVGGDACFPSASILDPMLLASLPKWQAIISGVDALTHAVEALWTTNATILTDAIAYECISVIVGNLTRAALTSDLEAKSRLHLAASMANIACGIGSR